MEIRADRLPFKRSGCRKCATVEGHLARYIQINGQTRCRWVCNGCGDYFTAGDLPFAWLRAKGIVIDDLPVCRDRSNEGSEFYDGRRCVVCGTAGAQAHHWAPQALFPEWPYELTVLLCQWHHDEWHHVTREHGLRYPHELLQQQEVLFEFADDVDVPF